MEKLAKCIWELTVLPFKLSVNLKLFYILKIYLKTRMRHSLQKFISHIKMSHVPIPAGSLWSEGLDIIIEKQNK